MVSTESISGEMSFHAGRPGHRCSPAMPVMDAWVTPISATLKPYSAYAASRSDTALSADSMTARPARPK